MKFFQAALLFVAAEAASLMSYHDSHHDHHEPEEHDTEHTHTKYVTKVVPVTTYVEKEVHGVTEEEVTKLVDTIESNILVLIGIVVASVLLEVAFTGETMTLSKFVSNLELADQRY